MPFSRDRDSETERRRREADAHADGHQAQNPRSVADQIGGTALNLLALHDIANYSGQAASAVSAAKSVRRHVKTVVEHGRAKQAGPASTIPSAQAKSSAKALGSPASASVASKAKAVAGKVKNSNRLAVAKTALGAINDVTQGNHAAAVQKVIGGAARGAGTFGINAVSQHAVTLADSRFGQGITKVSKAIGSSRFGQTAGSVGSFAVKASPYLATFRAGVLAAEGYQKEGWRGAGRGLIRAVDPTGMFSQLAGKTGLVSASMGDGRGLGERAYDAVLSYMGQAGQQGALGAPHNGTAKPQTTQYDDAVRHAMTGPAGLSVAAARSEDAKRPGDAGTKSAPPVSAKSGFQTKDAGQVPGQSNGRQSQQIQSGERGSDGKLDRDTYQLKHPTPDGRTSAQLTPKQQAAYQRRRKADVPATPVSGVKRAQKFPRAMAS